MKDGSRPDSSALDRRRESARQTEFYIVAQAGILEPQALLLCESIRRFAGAYASSAITVVSPQPHRRPGPATVRALERLDVDFLDLDVFDPCPAYLTSIRLCAAPELARRAGPPILVQLDSDTLFVDEPDFTLDGVDAAARPVDVKGMCTSGDPDDPRDKFWRDLCELCDVDYGRLPEVISTVDRQTVRASYNGGLLAVRRSSGIFERALDTFSRLVDANRRAHPDPATVIRTATRFVTGDGAAFWGTGQAAFSLAVTGGGHALRILPETHNIPLTYFDRLAPAASAPVHIHYHWLCTEGQDADNPMLDGRLGLSEETVSWLRERLPLREP